MGLSTLDLVRQHRDAYRVIALTANGNASALAKLAIEFGAELAVVADEAAYPALKDALQGTGIEAAAGAQALVEAAQRDVDWTMASIVGCAGLPPTMAAIQAGKTVALANKEALVSAGALMMAAVRQSGAALLPVDSEHNAIFQCLANGASAHASGVRKIMLTGSGGPFLRRSLESFVDVTPTEACAHPNWSMGQKISVDSATMMNKGLELIEARWLFDVSPDQIEFVVHPQSVVHSMVEYNDGAVVAQMGQPDMRTPIAHTLAWPERIDSGVPALDFMAMSKLEFEAADLVRFPCLLLARRAAEGPQSYAIALNAANEVAVQAFLDELIGFADIPIVNETVLDDTADAEPATIDEVLTIDAGARKSALRLIEQIKCERDRPGRRENA